MISMRYLHDMHDLHVVVSVVDMIFVKLFVIWPGRALILTGNQTKLAKNLKIRLAPQHPWNPVLTPLG